MVELDRRGPEHGIRAFSLHPAAGKGGVFCTNSEIAELEERTASMAIEGRDRRTSKVAPYAVDPASAERLWAISETMTEVGLLI